MSSGSKKWVWIIVAVVVVLGALWWSGVFGGNTPSQSAAVVNSTATAQPNPQNTAIVALVATLDVQMAKTQADVTALGTAPTKAQVAAAAADFKKSGALVANLISQFQSRLTNLKTAGTSITAAQAAINDLSLQMSNSSSQAGTAGNNAVATSTSSTALAQSGKQLAAAWQYLVNARADIAAVLKTIGN